MSRKLIIILFLLMASIVDLSARGTIVVSNNAIKMIVQELAGAKIEVHSLVPENVSPHTFAPKPSDMIKATRARIFIYVSDHMDAWIADMKLENKIELITLLKEEDILYFDEHCGHDHGHMHDGHNHSHDDHHAHSHDSSEQRVKDPHFWTDPMVVGRLLDPLVAEMGKLDPDNAAVYRANADLFKKRLETLDKRVAKLLDKYEDEPVMLFHPSFRYMLKRYGLKYIGAIEESAGKEPTAKGIKKIVEKLQKEKCRAIFTEPQLSKKLGDMISEAANVNVYELDPLGGGEGKIGIAI